MESDNWKDLLLAVALTLGGAAAGFCFAAAAFAAPGVWPAPSQPDVQTFDEGWSLTFTPQGDGATFEQADMFEIALLHEGTGETNTWAVPAAQLCDGIDPDTGAPVCVAVMNLGPGLYAFAVRVRFGIGTPWSPWSFTTEGPTPYRVLVPAPVCSGPPTNLAQQCLQQRPQIIAAAAPTRWTP